jgi:hypothetical protein
MTANLKTASGIWDGWLGPEVGLDTMDKKDFASTRNRTPAVQSIDLKLRTFLKFLIFTPIVTVVTMATRLTMVTILWLPQLLSVKMVTVSP